MKHIRILDGGLLVIHSTNVNIHVSLLQVFNIMPLMDIHLKELPGTA